MVDLTRMQNELRQQRLALQMMGFRFCNHCGKPHAQHGAYITVNRQTEAGIVSLPVCIDDPTNLICLIGALKTKELGHDTPCVFVDLAGTLAKWILDSGAFEPTHPMNGAVQVMMTGMLGVEPEDLAFSLMWWRLAPYSKTPQAQTYRSLIFDCGWDVSDEVYRGLLERCYRQAVDRGFKEPIRSFRMALKALDGADVAAIFSGLGAR